MLKGGVQHRSHRNISAVKTRVSHSLEQCNNTASRKFSGSNRYHNFSRQTSTNTLLKHEYHTSSRNLQYHSRQAPSTTLSGSAPPLSALIKCLTSEVAKPQNPPPKRAKHGPSVSNSSKARRLQEEDSLLPMSQIAEHVLAHPPKNEPEKKANVYIIGSTTIAAEFDNKIRQGRYSDAEKIFKKGLLDGVYFDIFLWSKFLDVLKRQYKADEIRESVKLMKSLGLKFTINTYTTILTIYKWEGDIHAMKSIYDEVKAEGLQPDTTFFNVFLDYYAKRGDLDGLAIVHAKMKSHQLLDSKHTYHIIMNGFGKAKRITEMMQTFEDMKRTFIPDRYSFNILMSGFLNANDYSSAFKMFEEMKKYSIPPQVDTYGILLSAYKRQKNLEAMESTMQAMQQNRIHPDDICYNTIISAFAEHRDINGVVKWCELMTKDGHIMNRVIYNAIVDNFPNAAEVFAKIRTVAPVLDQQMYASIIHLSGSQGKVEDMMLWFNDMKKNRVKITLPVCNSVIDGLGKNKEYNRMLLFYESTKSMGLAPNDITYSCMINHLAAGNLVEDLRRIIDEMKISGVPMGSDALATLLQAFGKHDWTAFKTLLDHIQQTGTSRLSSAGYQAIVESYSNRGELEEAKKWFFEYKKNGIDEHATDICNSMLNAANNFGDYKLVKTFWDIMEQSGVKPDNASFTTILNALAKQGRIDEMMAWFTSMKVQKAQPNIDALTAVLSGLGNHQYADLETMVIIVRSLDDPQAYVPLIEAFGKQKRMEEMFKFYLEGKSKGLELNIRLFHKMLKAIAQHGSEKDMQRVLEEMQLSGVKPDRLAYSFILNFYTRVGNNELLKWHEEVQKKGHLVLQRVLMNCDSNVIVTLNKLKAANEAQK